MLIHQDALILDTLKFFSRTLIKPKYNGHICWHKT